MLSAGTSRESVYDFMLVDAFLLVRRGTAIKYRCSIKHRLHRVESVLIFSSFRMSRSCFDCFLLRFAGMTTPINFTLRCFFFFLD